MCMNIACPVDGRLFSSAMRTRMNAIECIFQSCKITLYVGIYERFYRWEAVNSGGLARAPV